MIFYILVTVLMIWVFQRQWKMRRILALSRKLRNKYMALPIIGHGLLFFGTCEDRMKSIQKLGYEAIKSRFGLTSVWVGSEFYTMTCDPLVAGIVTKTSLDKTELANISRHLMGNGSIFAPIHIWRPRRKVSAPNFSLKNLNCFVEIFAEESLKMNRYLESRAGNGTFSIWNNISSYTMDSICQTTLGVTIQAQSESAHPFVLAFGKYCKITSAIVLQPWLHFDLIYPYVLMYYRAEKHRKIIHDFVDDIIRKKRELECEHKVSDLNTDSHNHSPVKTFLDLLKISSSENSIINGYTDLELREEILVLLLAGTDTSAVGASFTTVMLSRYMDVQEKAYEELREIFGGSKRPVTIQDLSRLTYIEAIVKETLRLYPPVPIIMRKNEEDIELTSGITLPVGSYTCINIWGLHRNPLYWGPDAEEFNPDRFLNENFAPRSAYMSFSYGPRNCLGYQYAMMSIKVAVATLLREYRVLPPSNMSVEDIHKPLRLEFDIMMKDVDNFKVRLERRT